MKDNDFKTLSQSESVKLWQKGKDAWNAWVEENPEYNIYFSGVDFSKHSSGIISFAGFKFPKGNVSFYNAKFGKGDVDFYNAKFGKGDVYFIGTSFGEGYVNFSRAIFSEGNVSFSDSTFGEGYVNFSRAIFSEGNVSFSDSTFGEGDVSFSGASFGEEYINFSKATFGKGILNFNKATFSKGFVNFFKVNFGEGDIIFTNTTFGEGDISFSFSKFQGAAIFINLRNIEKIKSFSFQYCTFNTQILLSSEEEFPCLVDLTGTKISHQPVLDGLKCRLPDEVTKGDISRARRLKELCENNADHQQAQDFHVLEMQAKKILNPPICKILDTDYWFKKLSNYGRSIILPAFWLLVITIAFAVFYSISTDNNWYNSLRLSTSQAFGFIPNSKNYYDKFCGTSNIFNSGCPDWLFLVTYLQTIISLMLLFLLGLGLRHRYRV